MAYVKIIEVAKSAEHKYTWNPNGIRTFSSVKNKQIELRKHPAGKKYTIMNIEQPKHGEFLFLYAV